MSDAVETSGVAVNTDRELWREPSMPPGMEYYAPSIHVTEGGGIGIDVGGIVFVKPLREWHRLAMVDSAPRALRIKGDQNDEA